MTTNQSTSAKKVPKNAAPKARAKRVPPEPTQLRLLDGGRTAPRAWQLDARTRRIGRRRVAEALEILHRARPTSHDKIAG